MSTLAPKLLDRYIFKQLLDYFLLGVVVFTLIAFFSETLLRFIREIQKYGIPFATLMTMVGLQLPKSIALVLPASSFLAVLMVYNHLNNQFEIIAMRMNGISLWRMMVPALVLGLFTSAMAYGLNDWVVPWCNAKTEQIKDQVIRAGTLPAGGNSFMYRKYDENHNLQQMIYISRYQGRKLGDSTIIDLSKKDVMQVVQARSGLWHPSEGWEFRNANIYLVARDTAHSSAGHADPFLVRGLINSEEALEKSRKDLRDLSRGTYIESDAQNFSELLSAIRKREAIGQEVRRNHYLELWEKLTWPLGCLAIILSAVPLSLSPPRAGSNRGFVYAIGVLFVFYMLYNIFQGLGQSAYFSLGGLLSLPAYLAVMSWLPLAVMTGIGVLLIRRKSHTL